MNGELQIRVETTVDEATEKRLQRYCTTHEIKKRDALRLAIALLVGMRRTEPPTFDPERPL